MVNIRVSSFRRLEDIMALGTKEDNSTPETP
jgi:hypothetical protein